MQKPSQSIYYQNVLKVDKKSVIQLICDITPNVDVFGYLFDHQEVLKNVLISIHQAQLKVSHPKIFKICLLIETASHYFSL
jgi:hypothetical protein